MGLIRLWRRELMRASAATLLVPAALLGLALAVAGTGLGGLGALRELVAGPDTLEPAAVVARPTARGPRAGLPAVPIAVAAASTSGVGVKVGSGPAPGGGRGGGGGGGSVGPGGGGGRPTTPASRPGGGSNGSGAGNPGAGGSPPPAHPAPSPSPVPAPGPVQSATQAVQQTAGSLPAPVGPAASDAVGTVGQLVGSHAAH
jgi:hypothetical protein